MAAVSPHRGMNRVSVKPEWLPIAVIVVEEGILHVPQSCIIIDRACTIGRVTNGVRQSRMVENWQTPTAKDP